MTKIKQIPKVSILIANYNGQNYVKRCIKSCLNQTYDNVEVIFVDDNSTDNSSKIAKKFKKIKFYQKKKSKKNNTYFNTKNQIETYKYAFKKSRGDYIFFLDSDDFFLKSKVKEIVNLFLENKELSIIFDNPIIFFSNKKKYKKKFINFLRNKNWPNFPPQSCISIKRKFLKKIFLHIDSKKFNLLTLDFRLASYSYLVYENFYITDKYLTYYYQNLFGESYIKFKKFSINWWQRRLQAHKYINQIAKNKKFKLSLDYFFTKITVILMNIFKK